jgi:HSP20 family molecular chaperone IbpA
LGCNAIEGEREEEEEEEKKKRRWRRRKKKKNYNLMQLCRVLSNKVFLPKFSIL